MRFNFEDLRKSGALEDLGLIKRGIEKESLRIDSNGSISSKNPPSSMLSYSQINE